MSRRIIALALALFVSAGVGAGVAQADVGKTTTYQIASLALAKYHVDLSLTGGASAGQCDPYRQTMPTKIVCGFPTNRFQGKCYVSINLVSGTKASGEVACGRVTGPKSKQWGWTVYYAWNGSTYSWHGRSGGVG